MSTVLEVDAKTPAAGTAPDAAIELRDVGVRFRVPGEKILSFKEYVLRRMFHRIEQRDLWAVRSVQLAIGRGESFGIVGRNGAGKSTLLRVISRVLRPTTGRVVVRGRVAPLLELGAGFHPDLTGRENVFLNATLFGYSRHSIQRALPWVIDFSGLEAFIDMPIRNYSSGMLARLGFSVATMYRPSILILDEVLAVGDAGFQQKCLARIDTFRKEQTTLVLVSHDAGLIASNCERVAWLDRGRVVALGPTAEVLPEFIRTLQQA